MSVLTKSNNEPSCDTEGRAKKAHGQTKTDFEMTETIMESELSDEVKTRPNTRTRPEPRAKATRRDERRKTREDERRDLKDHVQITQEHEHV